MKNMWKSRSCLGIGTRKNVTLKQINKAYFREFRSLQVYNQKFNKLVQGKIYLYKYLSGFILLLLWMMTDTKHCFICLAYFYRNKRKLEIDVVLLIICHI